jgi:hypothetical protein
MAISGQTRTTETSDRGRARIDVRYLVRVVSALDGLRRDARDTEVAYLKRLTAFAVSHSGAADTRAPDQGPASFAARLTRMGRGVSAKLGAIRYAALIPGLVGQTVRLARLRGAVEAGTCVLVAMASNRLSLCDGSADARTNLAALARSFGDRADERVARKIASADCVLVFDPLPLTRLWRHRERCRREGVLIVDGALLLVFFLVGLLRGFPRKWIDSARLARECRAAVRSWSGPRPAPSFRRAALYALASDTYAEMLGRSTKIEAVFFTCNSTLTELLRAYLIWWRGCERIDEVMHGIGSIQAEAFFAAVLSAGRERGAYEKHFFIPQVPRLPLYGVFAKQAALGASLAVNPYLNQYLIEHAIEPSSVEEFVRSEYRALRGESQPESGQRNDDRPEPVIIAVLGNTPYDGRLFESPSFKAECLLMSEILRFKGTIGARWLVVYVPHPVHATAAFTQSIFSSGDVRVYRNSVFCWLIADACVSLLSSALLEATYFGARGFTPLIVRDNFYTQAYLDLVSHPKSESADDLARGLHDFLGGLASAGETDVVGRACERLRLLEPGGSPARGWARDRATGGARFERA